MRFMIIVKATKDTEAGVKPEEKLFQQMAAYHEDMAEAGVLLGGSGLKPSAKGWRIKYDGDKRTLIDGPFAETKEVLLGFWVFDAASLDEAIGIAREFASHIPDGALELREVMEYDPGVGLA